MLITIAEAILDFKTQTATLQDWNNYKIAMQSLQALNNPPHMKPTHKERAFNQTT